MAAKSTKTLRARDLPEELAKAAAAGGARLEEYLKEFGKKIGDFSSEVDRLLEVHPKAAVISAFFLGVAIGRMSKR